MARKPPVKLPDVFAKPGLAPSRGTPIEALPQDAAVGTLAVRGAAARQQPMTVTSPDAAEKPAPVADTVTAADTVTVMDAAAVDSAAPKTEQPMTVTSPVSEEKAAPVADVLTVAGGLTVVDAPAVDTAASSAAQPLTVTPPVAEPKTAPAADALTVTPPAAEQKPAPVADPLTVVTARDADAPAAPTTVNPQITDATPDPMAVHDPTSARDAMSAPDPKPARDEQPAAWAQPSMPLVALPVAVTPEPPRPVPPPVATQPPPVAQQPAPEAAKPAPAAPATPYIPPQAPPTLPQPRGPAWTIAMVALGVSLTTPFWYDGALRLLGITTAINQAQQQDALSIMRQERTLQDVQQRLTTANAQLSKARTDLTEAARRQEETAAWTRMMILVRMSESLRRGTPFVAEIAMVRSSGAAHGDLQPMIDLVAPYATIGVPTAVDLANDFRRVTDPVLRPNRGFNPMAWAATVVAWTPFGRSAAETDPGRTALRDAGARMAAGRINEAVAILRPVTGPVAELMAGWLADTNARATADTLSTRVEAMLRATRR